MLSRIAILLALSAIVYAHAEDRSADMPRPAYPATAAEDIKDTLHGVEVRDPYRWLEDARKPEVKEWMAQQDAFTRAQLNALPGREEFAARLRKLYYVDSINPPSHRGERYFYSRRHANKEKSIVYWKEGRDGAEKVLFDPNTWSDDGSVSLGSYSVTRDGKAVAYSIKKNNSDEATLYLMDVASGKKSEIDVIEGAKYAHPSWTPDGSGFYYTWLPTDPKIPIADRPGFAEVRFHRVGQDPKTDAVVREKTGDPTTFIGAGLSWDGHWLILSIQHGWTAADVWFKDARDPNAKWQTLVEGKRFLYNVDVFEDVFYIHTNEDAPRFRAFKVNPQQPQRENWKEIMPQRADATLQGVSIVGGMISASYLINATTRLEVRGLDGALIREVQLPGVGTAWGLHGREDEDEAYFGFLSYTVPQEIYVTSVKTGETKLWTKLAIDIDPTPYVVEQVWYPSKDGTKVSMFLVHRKDMPRDGNNPVLLTGYGGFTVSMTPIFSSFIYPWLERGGVYAVPNLRGGGEYGEDWHRAGMRENKQNVFDDFTGAAQWLFDNKISRPERLAIDGGSNGGLLVGAMMVQHPEMVKTVICAVPLLDMVRFHLFGSGKTWTEEYGSADDPKMFPAILAYSPYHHVKAGTKYPSMLMLSADSDDRVDPMHARKFTAALQAASTGGPILLRIETNAGHGGADLVKAAVDKGADRLAFMCWQLGVKP